jgi:hypothetical protein
MNASARSAALVYICVLFAGLPILLWTGGTIMGVPYYGMGCDPTQPIVSFLVLILFAYIILGGCMCHMVIVLYTPDDDDEDDDDDDDALDDSMPALVYPSASPASPASLAPLPSPRIEELYVVSTPTIVGRLPRELPPLRLGA